MARFTALATSFLTFKVRLPFVITSGASYIVLLQAAPPLSSRADPPSVIASVTPLFVIASREAAKQSRRSLRAFGSRDDKVKNEASR